MGIEIYELTLIQRVSKLRRHYHPKSPMFRLIISLLVVNVASALRDSLPVLLLLMWWHLKKNDLGFIVPGYSPSLWGRNLKQFVIQWRAKTSICMLEYHSAGFCLLLYSPVSKTRDGSGHFQAVDMSLDQLDLNNPSLRMSSQVILYCIKLTIINANHHGKSFHSLVFSLWSCLTISSLRFMLLVLSFFLTTPSSV